MRSVADGIEEMTLSLMCSLLRVRVWDGGKRIEEAAVLSAAESVRILLEDNERF